MSQSEALTAATRPHSINDTRLFAALTAMGIMPVEGPQLYTGETPDGTPRQTWFLKRQSECGRYKTSELIAAWNDAQWHEGNPEHPFAYIKCAFENMRAAVDHIKQNAPLHILRGRGGKLGLIGAHDTKRTQEQILKILKR